jgi:RNA polymerase sigma factor (sigma-70 family)
MKPIDASASIVREAPEDPEAMDLEKTPKAGNNPRPPMTPAQQALALHYLPLARSLAKPFKKAWAPYWDDFESAACLGLVEAAQSYDASKQVEFPTYARRRILGELRDVKRDMQLSGWRDTEVPPTVEHLGRNTEEGGRVLGATPDPPVGKELEARDLVEHWLTRIPKTHANVCRSIYLESMTSREAGAVLGGSKTRINIIHQESLALLNESFYWKNKTAHPDDWVKPPLRRRGKTGPDRPESTAVSSVDLSPPDTVEP